MTSCRRRPDPPIRKRPHVPVSRRAGIEVPQPAVTADSPEEKLPPAGILSPLRNTDTMYPKYDPGREHPAG